MSQPMFQKLLRVIKSDNVEAIGKTLIHQAVICADPACVECDGSGLIGWGLAEKGIAVALVPCVRCRREEYQAAVKPFVKIIQAEQDQIQRGRNQTNATPNATGTH